MSDAPTSDRQVTLDAVLASDSAAGADGVLPFAVEPLDLRGRAVQLGPMLDGILGRHDYPEPVSRLLAEAITLTVLLGTSLKFEGKFILQTQTDGPVPMLVADFRTPHSVRAYARFDADKVAEAVESGAADTQAMLGEGVLAMTIDQGRYMQRYQGIVKLDGISLEEVARQYFRQSEQIPTDVRLAVSETYERGDEGVRHGWRAGGVLVQFLPDSEERMRLRDLPSGRDDEDADGFKEDAAWQEATALLQTVSDDELSDPTVEPERLLFRLFNEHGVRVFEPVRVRDQCSCSREQIADVLDNLDEADLDEAAREGPGDDVVTVDCQFCSKHYRFEKAELLARRPNGGEPTVH